MKNETTEKLIIALIAPTADVMRRAGIARMAIDGDNITLQLTSGEVETLRIGNPVRDTLGTHIAWSADQLGHDNAKTLINMLHA